jgi:predicted nucleic acid-binding protein
MELMDAIGDGPVALDTVVFIYFIEKNPRFAPLLQSLFIRIDSGGLPAVTSAVTLLETLVVPYRSGDVNLAATYEAILTNGRGLTLVPILLPVIRRAAPIRAATAIRLPDALQLAAASLTNCTAFLTNDRRIPSIAGISVLQLDAFVPPS